MNPNQQIIIYKTEDGKISVDTLIKDESIWLSQKSMAQLFNCSIDNVSLHLKNIYETGELNEKATSEDFSVVQKEGNREVSRKIKHYNLDATISVGYRVNSIRGTQFRVWATYSPADILKKVFLRLRSRLRGDTSPSGGHFGFGQQKLAIYLRKI